MLKVEGRKRIDEYLTFCLKMMSVSSETLRLGLSVAKKAIFPGILSLYYMENPFKL